MSFLTVFLVGVGVSADAFAASVTSGIKMHRFNYRHAVAIALTFGGFQALMPFLGWLLATWFADVIEPVDHWIAFGLLILIGGKMIWDALFGTRDPATDSEGANEFALGRLLLLGFATSIDAGAVGVSLAVLGASILPAIAVIGATTLVVTFLGVIIGYQLGRFRRPAEVIGGLVLIAIGVQILLDHLGVLG